jgi:AcrR family transcriptional regulator
MGYTVGNLYLLFANQDELLAAVSARTADALLEHLRAAAAPRREAMARLRAIAHGYIEFAQAHEHRWRLMFEHRLPPDSPAVPGLEARQQVLFEFVRLHLAPLLPGSGPSGLHAATTALWSSVHGLCVLAVTGKLGWSGIHDYRGLSDLIVQALVSGLPGPGGGRPRTKTPRHGRA